MVINNTEKTARPRGTDSAKVIQVIVTESIEGRGISGDPVRCVLQYWSLEGELLAKCDSFYQSQVRLEEST